MYGTTLFRKPLAMLCGLFLVASTAGAADAQVTDSEIQNALDRKLIYDPVVNANRVQIDVNQGIVELTGSVNALLTKERAVMVAKRLKGVRGVSDRLTVQPSRQRSDKSIRTDVILSLIQDPVTEAYKVSVAVDDGTVTLTGAVDSWQERQFASRVAKSVKGVKEVVDRITVSFVQDRSDQDIKAEVEKRIEWDVLLRGYLIQVSVDDGVVALSGTVGSLAERDVATRLGWVAGVEEVKTDQLIIHDWAKDDMVREESLPDVDDTEIKEAISDAMRYDPRVLSFDVDVQVDHGYATLRGSVDNLRAKSAAGRLAENVVGVYSVDNRIKVVGVDVYDYEIVADVNSALFANPYIESYEIGVQANNGTVTLTGSVDTYFEKAEAADEAASVVGVSRVINQINVYEDTGYYRSDLYYYPVAPLIGGQYLYRPRTTFATDMAIKDDIESELFWSPFVDHDQVTVTVVDGIATLTGTVDSWREFRAASDNAYDGGAVVVRNQLLVE